MNTIEEYRDFINFLYENKILDKKFEDEFNDIIRLLNRITLYTPENNIIKFSKTYKIGLYCINGVRFFPKMKNLIPNYNEIRGIDENYKTFSIPLNKDFIEKLYEIIIYKIQDKNGNSESKNGNRWSEKI